jgi:hypothetical protein
MKHGLLCQEAFGKQKQTLLSYLDRALLTRTLLTLATMRLETPRLTLFGRSLVLVICELVANAALWVVCGLLFGRDEEKRSILNLALLAWVIFLTPDGDYSTDGIMEDIRTETWLVFLRSRLPRLILAKP